MAEKDESGGVDCEGRYQPYRPGQAMTWQQALCILEAAEAIPAGHPVRTGGRTYVLVEKDAERELPGAMIFIPMECHEALLDLVRDQVLESEFEQSEEECAAKYT